ncbi:MAG: hypothetical protein M3163_11905, partial [Actinomycetota bacterium]|nr:hypothetical protein [Actinomycetota bacterium]
SQGPPGRPAPASRRSLPRSPGSGCTALNTGAGGQFGIVLDGQLVSVSRFGGAPPAANGVVTGLDAQTVRNLAARLGR